jgi:hypothetical protein
VAVIGDDIANAAAAVVVNVVVIESTAISAEVEVVIATANTDIAGGANRGLKVRILRMSAWHAPHTEGAAPSRPS